MQLVLNTLCKSQLSSANVMLKLRLLPFKKLYWRKRNRQLGLKKLKKKRKRESQAAAKYEAQMKVKQEKEAAEFAAAAEQAERDSMDLVSSCLFAYTVNE